VNSRTGTAVQHKISFQTVDTTTGLPTGTVVAAAVTPIPDVAANATIRAVNITHDGVGGTQSSYQLTRGGIYAMVIEPCPDSTAPCSAATTPDASNFLTFTRDLGNLSARQGLPYPATFTTGAWTKILGVPAFGYRTASLTRGYPVQSTTTTTTISSGAETGVSFNIPSTLCSSLKVAGVRAQIQTSAAGKITNMNLYSGTTVLQGPRAINANTSGNAASLTWIDDTFHFTDASLSALSCGTTYRIGFAPQDASNNFMLHAIDMATSGDRTAFAGGTMFALASRTTCGAPCDGTSTAWAADTTTSRPFIELILDDWTLPAGTGGQTGYTFIGMLQRNPLDLFAMHVTHPGKLEVR
jgi:hypothetical protein